MPEQIAGHGAFADANTTHPSISQAASSWLASFSFDRLPADIVTSTRLRVLDVLGNVIAATRSPFGSPIRDAGAAMADGGTARVIGFGDRTSAPVAAFVNGSLAVALDFDDTHTATILHFSSPTVVAALALSSVADARESVVAIACGSELMCRLGMCAPGEFHRRGFHATGILGAVGAAFTAARILRLSAGQTANAIGVAAAHTASLTQAIVEGKPARFLSTGYASQLGLTAAFLARAGLEAPAAIFEGERGLFPTHVGESAKSNVAEIFGTLGEDWETRRSSFKPFPCGHVIHPIIQATLAVLKQQHFAAGDIRSVVCHVPSYAVPMVCEPAARRQAPASDNEARISLQYTVAETLFLGRLDGNSYKTDSLSNPAILQLANRVSYVADPEFNSRQRYGGKVVITLNDGRSVSHTEPAHWGSPELPFGAEDVRQKFRANLSGSELAGSPAEIIKAVEQFEHLTRIDDLVDLCCPRR